MITSELARAGDAQRRAARSAGGGVLRTRTVAVVTVADNEERASRSRTHGVSPKGSTGRRGRNSVLLRVRRFMVSRTRGFGRKEEETEED
jgi:hypothetical protein